jgi:hypothetical protein
VARQAFPEAETTGCWGHPGLTRVSAPEDQTAARALRLWAAASRSSTHASEWSACGGCVACICSEHERQHRPLWASGMKAVTEDIGEPNNVSTPVSARVGSVR